MITEKLESKKDLIKRIKFIEKHSDEEISYCIRLSWESKKFAPECFKSANEIIEEWLMKRDRTDK